MGLKTIAYGPWSAGKSWLGLSMAQGGPIGLIDTEQRMEGDTEAAPETPGPFPFDRPRVVLPTLAPLAPAASTIYLVQTNEIAVAGRAIEGWARDSRIVGMVLDSGSVLWDLLMDTRDESDPRTA